jgi:hypothetical protein
LSLIFQIFCCCSFLNFIAHNLHCFPSLSFNQNLDQNQEARQSRKRSKSQQSSRSRGSRSNSANKSIEQHQQLQQPEQPEYINISSLEETRNKSTADLSVHHPTDMMQQKAEWNKRAIGPDAWYNDDFNYDKGQHSFADDPLLNHQYGQLLDMRYKLVQTGAPPPPPKAFMNQLEADQHVQMDPSITQICHDVEMEHKPVVQLRKNHPAALTDKQQRSKTWHGDKFADLHIMEKKDSNSVLLTVNKDALSPERKPRRSFDTNSVKEPWSPVKVIEEFRKAKEAPPKNVVQDRRKKFESQQEEQDVFNVNDIDDALADIQKAKEEVVTKQKQHSGIVREFALSDSKESSDGMSKEADSSEDSNEQPPTGGGSRIALQKKRSVLELLSDFEKKSQKLQEEEKSKLVQGGSSELSGSRRRVFSDTETMMYDTSSDEDDSTFDQQQSTSKPQPALRDQVRKSSLPTLSSKQLVAAASGSTEDNYLPMTPPKSKPVPQDDQYLPLDPQKQNAVSRIPTYQGPDKRNSLTSSISNSSLLTNQETKTIRPQIQDTQGRRPSQSMVMEHLVREFGTDRAKAILESFTETDPTLAKRPSESPRYCEIEDDTITKPSHYEYLFKATSEAEQPPIDAGNNYESVYQEIPEDSNATKGAEALPDILGNAPTGRGHSSSDADDEAGKESNLSPQKLDDQSSRSLFEVSGTFTPASFFLDNGNKSNGGRSMSTSSDIGPSTPSKTFEKLGSQNSLSSRELPQTPTASHRSSNEELHPRRHFSFQDDASSPQRRPKNLENIQEIPGAAAAAPRTTPQPRSPLKNPSHGILKQDINLTYQSVYENEDIGFSSSSSNDQQTNQHGRRTTPKVSSSSDLDRPEGPSQDQQQGRVPYYVSDISKSTEELLMEQQNSRPQQMKRRAHTPDSFLLEQAHTELQQQQQGPIMTQDGVVRSKSLEGLLGDGHAGMRDSVQVNMHPYPQQHNNQHHQVVVPISSPSISSYRSTPLPARGHDPPPPPPGVPPLDLTSFWQQRNQDQPILVDDDDDSWRESLRRASAKQKARDVQPPPPRLIQPGPFSHDSRQQQYHHHPPIMVQPEPSMVSPHINGYMWDQREQRFYRLNDDPSAPNPRLFRQPFLDQGLPTHTSSDHETTRIRQLTQQRPKSVGPVHYNNTQSPRGMMGRPSSTLPTYANNNGHQSKHNQAQSAQIISMHRQHQNYPVEQPAGKS